MRAKLGNEETSYEKEFEMYDDKRFKQKNNQQHQAEAASDLFQENNINVMSCVW